MSDAPALELEYRPFSLPLSSPLETADGTIDSREGFLVRLTERGADEAPVGYGEATPLAGWTESLAECEAALERAREALREGGPAEALATVERQVAARHAVSLALADYRATQSATPLYRYFGTGEMIARVPVNATIGGETAAENADSANEAVSRGFDCCKLKVGRGSVDDDVERVRRVREAVGPEISLRVDANGAWTFEEAERAIEAFADLEVSLLEQPLPAGALEGHAELRGRGVPIGLDEGLLEHGVDAICEGEAADVVVLKPMALGGIDVAREVAIWLAELEITSIVTTTIDGVVARTGAVHLAAALPESPPAGLATAELLADDLGRDPVLLEGGSAVVPQAKGLGVDGVWET